eukprot:10786842-Prorocentrum_lima.AAC.1
MGRVVGCGGQRCGKKGGQEDGVGRGSGGEWEGTLYLRSSDLCAAGIHDLLLELCHSPARL